MFEIPEMLNLAKQINEALQGKTIRQGTLGNSPHKFVWYNRTHEEFEQLTQGKVIGEAHVMGRFMTIPVEPGYVLLLGECGGKVLLHEPRAKLPKKYHLYLHFEDDSFFTVTTQMWGAMELYKAGEEMKREYVRGMATTPVESEFTFEYFDERLDELVEGKKRSVKSLLTQEQTIPGLGNAIAQDIMFISRLNPRYPISELVPKERETLYHAIVDTVAEITEKGGRYDEFDLYGQRGGYVRLMDKEAVKRPCPACGGEVKKIQYLGGACYICPKCQE